MMRAPRDGRRPMTPTAGLLEFVRCGCCGVPLMLDDRCPVCERRCETDPHVCGSPTRLVRGSAWMTNDAVNACATAIGAIAAGWIAIALR